MKSIEAMFMFMPKKMLALEDKFDVLECQLCELDVDGLDFLDSDFDFEIGVLGCDIEFLADSVCHIVQRSKA